MTKGDKMHKGSTIVSVSARQVYADRGHPGIETTVVTQNGAKGCAVVTAGVSVGAHEVLFLYDGGKRWRGKGVLKAVDIAVNTIGPAITGMDASCQQAVDGVLIELDGTPNKSKLGGDATASVSAAVLQAGAASLGLPLYQHIGGVHACVLPVPGVLTVVGSRRYGHGLKSGGKPSYSMMCYGFSSFSDASYAAWEVSWEFVNLVREKLDVDCVGGRCMICGNTTLVKPPRSGSSRHGQLPTWRLTGSCASYV
jgi:enolase